MYLSKNDSIVFFSANLHPPSNPLFILRKFINSHHVTIYVQTAFIYSQIVFYYSYKLILIVQWAHFSIV